MGTSNSMGDLADPSFSRYLIAHSTLYLKLRMKSLALLLGLLFLSLAVFDTEVRAEEAEDIDEEDSDDDGITDDEDDDDDNDGIPDDEDDDDDGDGVLDEDEDDDNEEEEDEDISD